MFSRVELVLYFDLEEQAQDFVDRNVSQFSDEPYIDLSVNGFAIRKVRYPEKPSEPMDMLVRSYGSQDEVVPEVVPEVTKICNRCGKKMIHPYECDLDWWCGGCGTSIPEYESQTIPESDRTRWKEANQKVKA